MAQAVGTVNMAYNSRLELLQAGDYDSITIQGQAPDWPEVLAVFAVKTAGADVDGLDVATLDADRVNKLTSVFWDMTAIARISRRSYTFRRQYGTVFDYLQIQSKNASQVETHFYAGQSGGPRRYE